MSGSLADPIAPHLPYLRRFARALTGDRKHGGAYVVALLEALVADDAIFDRRMSPRAALYRSFIRTWNTVPLNGARETVGSQASTAADKRIEAMTPLARQAFLLAALEEFSVPEIGRILDKGETEVGRLIDTAGREIAEQIKARMLIIEDEPLIALDIEGLVGEIGHEVVGIARTRKEAGRLAERKQPGLVLADIQLADGSSGIDAVNDILGQIDVPVIFITAYPERLLTGQRAEPTFLVTKPFKPEMVKAVISQALYFDVGAKSGTAMRASA
jgi:CheY-like chemotaxis protein